jgi:hypothetical protein
LHLWVDETTCTSQTVDMIVEMIRTLACNLVLAIKLDEIVLEPIGSFVVDGAHKALYFSPTIGLEISDSIAYHLTVSAKLILAA